MTQIKRILYNYNVEVAIVAWFMIIGTIAIALG
jgi:hypothetical protein